jgi:hypothetical protein
VRVQVEALAAGDIPDAAVRLLAPELICREVGLEAGQLSLVISRRTG